MSRLWWTVVAVFLTAQSIDAVDVNKLSEVVNHVWNLYNPSYESDGKPVYPMFSLALSIPYNQQRQQFDLDAVTNLDKPDVVKAAMINCRVYIGSRVVGATVLSRYNSGQQCPQERVPWDFVRNRCPNVNVWQDFNTCPQSEIETLQNSGNKLADHAEYRVHQNFNTVFSQMDPNIKNTDFMLFYAYQNPCAKCMDQNNWLSITPTIELIKYYWTNRAFVFTHMFAPHGSGQDRSVINPGNHFSIKTLGEILGLKNVYRCGTQGCISCYDGRATDKINEGCLKD